MFYLIQKKSALRYMWRKSVQSVELLMKEISVTPLLVNCHGYMNQHLVCSFICACQTLIVKHKVKQSTNKNQTRKCFVQLTKSCCSVFFIASVMVSFSIAVRLDSRKVTQFQRDKPCVSVHIKIANEKQNFEELELAKEKRRHFLYRLFF